MQRSQDTPPLPRAFPLWPLCAQGSPLELHLAAHFMEDRGPAMHSYADWMMLIHKAVLSK